jgi:CheY-like chemotaxis protein
MAGYTVLVVEDDFVQRRQIARVLEGFGYRLLQAADGMAAIRLVDAEEINLVLTDIRMPLLDGISLLKYIKIFYPHIPVVVATAYPEEMEDLRPDALLCKPFGEEELIACIRRLTTPSN